MANNIFNDSNIKLSNELKENELQLRKPQLVFTITQVEPQFPKEHESFTIYFNFQNIGDADAGEFTIRMITANIDDNSLGVDQEDQPVNSLKQGITGCVALKFKYGMPAGNYVIDAYLDYFNQIPEQNEDMIYRHTFYSLIVS